MKLEKAIKILEVFINESNFVPNPDIEDAGKLGIEALKIVLDTRRLPGMADWRVLPGETR